MTSRWLTLKTLNLEAKHATNCATHVLPLVIWWTRYYYLAISYLPTFIILTYSPFSMTGMGWRWQGWGICLQKFYNGNYKYANQNKTNIWESDINDKFKTHKVFISTYLKSYLLLCILSWEKYINYFNPDNFWFFPWIYL